MKKKTWKKIKFELYSITTMITWWCYFLTTGMLILFIVDLIFPETEDPLFDIETNFSEKLDFFYFMFKEYYLIITPIFIGALLYFFKFGRDQNSIKKKKFIFFYFVLKEFYLKKVSSFIGSFISTLKSTKKKKETKKNLNEATNSPSDNSIRR